MAVTMHSDGGSSSGAVGLLRNSAKTLLRRGSRGEAVRTLQKALNTLGFNCGAVDGIFGSKTEAAVKAFQRAYNLKVDGIVGPQTWGKIIELLESKTSAGQPVAGRSTSTSGTFLSAQVDATKKPSWFAPLDSCYFVRSLRSKAYDMHSDIDPTKFTPEQIANMMYHDELAYGGRGRLVQAFPTYLILFIDEGEWVGGRKLWNNFYFYHSLVGISIVKDRKNPADLAYIEVTNTYGALNSQQLTPTMENSGGLWERLKNVLMPVIEQKSIDARKRLLDELNINPGTRVHIRMGYGAVASRLPVLFNGTIVEVNADEIVTFVAQGDGHELMNVMSGFSGEDKTGLFRFGITPDSIIRNIMTKRGWLFHINAPGWVPALAGDVVGQYQYGASSPYGIEHFGTVRKLTDLPGITAQALGTIQTWDVMMNVYPFALSNADFNKHWKELRSKVASNTPSAQTSSNSGGEKRGILDKLRDVWNSITGGGQDISLLTGPYISVFLANKTPWDVIKTCTLTADGYVAAVLPFQFRSTLFIGMPFWPVCIRYRRKTGKGMVLPGIEASGMPTTTLLRRGSRGEEVRMLQEALNALGFNCGAVDGIFGPKTEAAVKAFQRQYGLTVDGIVGPQTWGKIIELLGSKTSTGQSVTRRSTSTSTPLLKLGSRGEDVKRLQMALNKLGFNCGAVDGIFGPKTQAAVKAFQKKYGLKVDGIVGPQTWSKINALLK